METQSVNGLKILLADDGSAHSQAAVSLLCDLPLTRSSKVISVCVMSVREGWASARGRAVLDRTRKRFQDCNIQIETILQVGNPAETLISIADRIDPHLIVMGAVGLRATLGILLGGVAQQVVEYSHHPVLVVRAPYQGLHNVLLATDGSLYSQRAMEYLCKGVSSHCLPLPMGTRINVLHVIPPPLAKEVDEYAYLEIEEEGQGKALLGRTVAALKSAGLDVNGTLLRGDAATEIIEFSRARQIDLIVIGSRGLSEVQGWLLGSVSRKLVHYANCSVLIARQ